MVRILMRLHHMEGLGAIRSGNGGPQVGKVRLEVKEESNI